MNYFEKIYFVSHGLQVLADVGTLLAAMDEVQWHRLATEIVREVWATYLARVMPIVLWLLLLRVIPSPASITASLHLMYDRYVESRA